MFDKLIFFEKDFENKLKILNYPKKKVYFERIFITPLLLFGGMLFINSSVFMSILLFFIGVIVFINAHYKVDVMYHNKYFLWDKQIYDFLLMFAVNLTAYKNKPKSFALALDVVEDPELKMNLQNILDHIILEPEDYVVWQKFNNYFQNPTTKNLLSRLQILMRTKHSTEDIDIKNFLVETTIENQLKAKTLTKIQAEKVTNAANVPFSIISIYTIIFALILMFNCVLMALGASGGI